MGLIERVCLPVGGDDDALDWPWWVPVGCIAVAIATTLKVLADRDALLSPGPETLLGVLALSPWLADLGLFRLTGRMLVRPLFAAVVIGAVTALLVEPTRDDFAPFLILTMLAEVAATATLRVTAATTMTAIAALAGLDLADQFDGAAVWIAGFAAAGALGALLRSRMHLLERERVAVAQTAERAAVAERQRIAREVHDVIAHSLSVTMLHVTGTRHLLETEGDVDEAVVALRDAERLGRQAMADIRRTVGLLGQATEPGAPMPGLADLDELVADFRAAGLEVGHRLRGDPDLLSAATGLGLYRIVQESLANVAKHAPGARTDVHVDLTGDPLQVRVRNGSPGGRKPPGIGTATGVGGPGHPSMVSGDDGSAGLGLHGMRQRAELLGGELRAGPHGDGWCVEVTIPRATGATGATGRTGALDEPETAVTSEQVGEAVEPVGTVEAVETVEIEAEVP